MNNEYRNTMLISSNELKSTNTYISSNVDDRYLSSTICTVQDVYLEGLTGTALYYRLQELVYNAIKGYSDSINDLENEDYKDLLDGYVKPFLKARCTADILFALAFKVRNTGITRTADTNLQPVPMDDVKYLESQYKTYADAYSEKLSKYLCANRDKFGELASDIPSYFSEPSMGKEYGNTGGLWLGGSRKKRTCGGCK